MVIIVKEFIDEFVVELLQKRLVWMDKGLYTCMYCITCYISYIGLSENE